MKIHQTGTCKIKPSDNLRLSQTVDLPTILKICDGVQCLLTVNINVADKLINGSIGTNLFQ